MSTDLPRIYYVQMTVFGYEFSMHTPDQAKIGPWLLDLVDMMKLPDRPGMPVEIRVTIT